MGVEFKAINYTLLSLDVGQISVSDLLTGLKDKLSQTPLFFKDGSLVLNVVEFMSVSELWSLVDGLENIGIKVIAISGMVDKQISLDLCLPFLQKFRGRGRIDIPNSMATGSTVLYVNGSVPSGVVIEGGDKDVVVFGDVSHGASIITGGSIVVTGKAEGQFTAGCDGNMNATIFAKKLNPQYIKISSVMVLGYLIDLTQSSVMFSLECGVLKAQKL
jgi:septum site-determining protein MinC